MKHTIRKLAAAQAFFCLFSASALKAQTKLYPNEFSLKDVKLLESPFKHAQDLNIQTLLKYDVDRLFAGYRKEAGLPSKAAIFQNWADLDGHVGGHYISALAINYAATGDMECKKRLDYIIGELKACQDANTSTYPDWARGYVGAVPNGIGIWPKIKSGDVSLIWKYWVPWYNVHKTYAGLRDAWLYTGSEQAKQMFLKFCDWGIDITSSLSDSKMNEMLGNEHGGMNEVYADAYAMTGEEKYLRAAKRFSHKMLLDAMAASTDNLDNKHANTQVPKAIGFERIGEIAKDETYKKAGSFFWETVTTNRSIALGGNSRREFFPSRGANIDFVNDVEGPESCNTYNMLKLTEDLFRVDPQARYADYYEKALYNHILSTQHPTHGGYVYFTPARPRHYRVYSSPNEGMWCCVGSGMENHGKYGQFIYTHTNNDLFVNLFLPSELTWKEKGIKLKQQTNFPYQAQTSLEITEGKGSFALKIRYPQWVKEGEFKVLVNGKSVETKALPSSYVSLNRTWKKGDRVDVMLPMHTTVEHLPNVPNYIAFMHGPILLGAKTGTEDLRGLIAGDSRWGHIASGKKLAVDKAPILIEDNIESLGNKLTPVSGKPLTFKLTGVKIVNPTDVVLEPFYKIHDSRYMMYWMGLSNKQYKSYLDSVAKIEEFNLALQKRTVDFVAPGEQQPEADHFIQKQNSNTGNTMDQFWRSAQNDGFFSYSLSTNKETNLSLIVRYWGAESGNRKFDIYINDKKLASEDISGKWNQQQFQEVEYSIPESILKGKEKIIVKFQGQQGNIAGPVYYVRLVRK
ncbi:glycoside hydrolase family 127 protein [Desertivirga arenae]|uniref:glycoside hydrolase family 127 protein n=1 Tax=Desertivirga arenae TaxID=2810309 RepID=UPI001A971775|nr:glycoside hydrolase family 127 protein [Pedobacter sp. SYSU D00823]